MSTVLETEIVDRELELASVVSAMEACFECQLDGEFAATPSVFGGGNIRHSSERRSLTTWFQPTSRLDWFSRYTMKSVFLIVSFLAIGLFVSSLVLSL
ncbi:MAG: hypothetical protein Q8M16_04980 [Pirellulaceae bacterium]|nr:hypothetical protein [Pirellulaceae bacterium]